MKTIPSSAARECLSLLVFTTFFLFCGDVSAQWLVFDSAVEATAATLTKELSASIFRKALLEEIALTFKTTPVVFSAYTPNILLSTAILSTPVCEKLTLHRADAEINTNCFLLTAQIAAINAAREAFYLNLVALQAQVDLAGVGLLSSTTGALATESFKLLKLQTTQANTVATYVALMEAYKLNLVARKEAYLKSTLKKLLGSAY